MPRLTKIYTRKGDEGFTQLGDKNIPKDDLLVEAIGNLDELNSFLGFLLAQKISDPTVVSFITQVQNDLFDLGGELHLPQYTAITADKVTALEKQLDTWNQTLPVLQEFILPRGKPPAAACHLARTVCRRTERCIVRLHRQEPLQNKEILCYLNRLSDVLFVLARLLNKEDGNDEPMWNHKKQK